VVSEEGGASATGDPVLVSPDSSAALAAASASASRLFTLSSIRSIGVGPVDSLFFGFAGFLFFTESVPRGGSEEGAGDDDEAKRVSSLAGGGDELLVAAGTGTAGIVVLAFEAVALPLPFLVVTGVVGVSAVVIASC
jgi:hypothetical protein